MKTKSKLKGIQWFNLILFGLMGQIAWAVENMYFNTFLYNSVYNGASQTAVNGSIDVMDAISRMVAFSAVTAVVTTFIMGVLSDRVNNRKWFISIGYILWGIITACFGFITRDNIALLFSLQDEVKILTATVVTVIVMDCVMTFMGSTSNDSAFNAWVTDITDVTNRATTESVLALMPVFAMGIVMALGGLVGVVGYPTFFIVLGAVVTVCGIIGIFTVKDSREEKKTHEKQNFFAEFIYGFRPSVVKENKNLYLSLCAMALFNIAYQVFFPYIFIYLQHTMNFTFDKLLAGLTPKIIIIAAVCVVVLVAAIISLGRLMDKIGKEKCIYLSVILYIAGLVVTGLNDKSLGGFGIGMLITMAGYGCFMILFGASVRDYTPEDKTGMFQGIRMIFIVLLPMIIGPFIGKEICRISAITYINEYGVAQSAPGAVMFFAAAAVSVLILIPVVFLKKSKIQKS